MKKVLVLLLMALFMSGCAETWKHMTKLKKDKPAEEQQGAQAQVASPANEPVNMAELKQTINALNSKIDELNASITSLREKVDPGPAAQPAKPEEIKETDIMEAPSEEVAPAAASASTEIKTPQPLNVMYDNAYSLFRNKSYNESITAFDSLLEAYPKSDLSDNALYWKGESYYAMGNFQDALRFFLKTAEDFPDGNKTPAAQLKAGFAYQSMQNKEGAKRQYQKVIDLYPFSQQAETAIKKLNSL